MNSPTILRPLRLEERPWNVRHATLVRWVVFGGLLVFIFYSSPNIIHRIMAGDGRAIRSALSMGVYPLVMLFATFTIPKALAKQQRNFVTITDDDITLKMRSAGVEPERTVWTVKRDALREVRPFGAGRQAQFIFLMKADSAAKRFWQLANTARGMRLRVADWVLNTCKDVNTRPSAGVKKLFMTSTDTRKAMFDSDLGRALIEHGYLKPAENLQR